MNTEKLEKLKKSLDNKFIPDNMKDKIRAEIKKLEADIKTDETITATEVKEEVKEIEKKVEKALEVAEEKEEQAEAKKEEAQEKAEAKAEEKKAKKSRTKTQKVEGKPKSAKKSVFSIAKEIRKDGETWEEAKDRARKMMKSETTETKKKTKTETQKLLAMVRRNKEYKKLAGTSDLPKDAQRRALPRGKRVSENGNVYYENRANRVDVGGFKNAYLENGGGVDGIIELKPLVLIPLSTQLNRLSGYGWTYGDWESEDGGKPSTMPNSVIVNVHTKQKFRLSPFYIYEGYDHYNSKPLYRVEDASEEGEYVGEWYTKREDAEQELKEMFGSYADKGVYVETLDEEIDLTDDGKPRVIKTQQGGNKSFGERREMHGASPEALAFDNGGKVGRYSILGEVDGEQPVLYATTDDKERIKPLVNMAEIDLYELTGKNHRIFVTDEVTDNEVYHYGNGGRTRERRYVNYSQDYEVRYSKDKPHRRGYGYAGGGVVLDNIKIEVYKSFHGLKAENYFDDVNGYDWNVVTMKRHTGELVSSARGGKANKSEGNVEFFTFDYNSPNIKLISSRPSRVTEKVIEIQHSQALQLFKEKMEEGNFADGGTIIGTPETPLARGLDIDYTGLVGETGGMSAGEMFAMGGSLGNHGLKQGDQIIKTMSGGVQKVKTKSGDIVYVNLANGYRGAEPPLPFSDGGSVKRNLSRDRKFKNYSEKHEFNYSKNKPHRRGYGYEEGGFMTDPNFGDFQSGVYATGGGVGKKKTQKELRNEYLEKLGSKEADVWDKIGAESGSQIRNSDKMLKAYAEGVEEMLQKEGVGKGSFDQEDYDFYTDENWHLFNEFLVWNGYYEPEMTKTEKAWREDRFKNPKYRNYVSNPSIIKVSGSSKSKSNNYLPKRKISTITIVKDGKEIVLDSKDVLNGVNLYDAGGKLKNDYVYFAKRYVKEVITEDGDKFNPSNGYWVKKSALKSSNKIKSDFFEEDGLGVKYVKNGKFDKAKFKKDMEERLKSKRAESVIKIWARELGMNPSKYIDGEIIEDVDFINDSTKKASDLFENKFEGGGKTTFKEKATAIAKKFEGKKVEPKYQKEYGKTYDKAEAKEVGNKIAGSQKAKYDAKMSKGGSTKRGGAMQLAKEIRKEGESWQSALKRANEQIRNQK